MRTILGIGIPAVLLASLVLIAQAPQAVPAGDPKTPVFWSAKQLKDLATGASQRVSTETNMAAERLLPSATMIYRTGNSGAEVHEKLADFISVREGEGVVLIGGKIINGKPSAPDEIRGDSIEGGTRYPIAAGDTIYIPANMPHQFFVEQGKHWVITIAKITPKP